MEKGDSEEKGRIKCFAVNKEKMAEKEDYYKDERFNQFLNDDTIHSSFKKKSRFEQRKTKGI